MSRIDDDERRLYQCARKYEQIVNQGSKASKDSAAHLPSYEAAANDGEVFVESITKFLHEFSAESAVETDSSSSASLL
ncbi:unnamed protein product [Linum tenue]|uniref:Uncharacterized protein n=1 Tax=Linum tenue TaxID=586396 RepID=A0AAV0PP44_9ROSI|nr:unnamed protein product [Linum tenue]